MARTIKVRCNGPGQHENEIDIDALIEEDRATVFRMITIEPPPPQLRQRYVLPCQFCTEGKVIVLREWIEDALKQE